MLVVAFAHRAEVDAVAAFERAKNRMQVLHARYLNGQSSYRKVFAARVAFHHACCVQVFATRRHTRFYRAHVRARARSLRGAA